MNENLEHAIKTKSLTIKNTLSKSKLNTKTNHVENIKKSKQIKTKSNKKTNSTKKTKKSTSRKNKNLQAEDSMKLAKNKLDNKKCNDPIRCFGLNGYNIRSDVFDNFQNPKYIEFNRIVPMLSDFNKIDREGGNNFIFKVPYVKNGNHANTVLKISKKKTSDNLHYEYYIGTFFINKINTIYPCFVETYNLINIPKLKIFLDKTQQNLKNIFRTQAHLSDKTEYSNFNPNEIPDVFKMFDYKTDAEFWEKSCKKPVIGLQLQYLNKPITFYDFYKNHYDYGNTLNIIYDYHKSKFLFGILYQIYYTLNDLYDTFTHYDLHQNNILLFTPFNEGEYIEFNYHHKNKIVKFYSPFIVKIIDYGRSYFNNGEISTSDILNDYICKLDVCEPSCGKNVGYGIIRGNYSDSKGNKNKNNSLADTKDKITTNQPNVSADLRFMHVVDDQFKFFMKYGYNVVFKYTYVTTENEKHEPFVINNVADAFTALNNLYNDYDKPNKDNKSYRCDFSCIKMFDELSKIIDEYGTVNEYTNLKIRKACKIDVYGGNKEYKVELF
jgi:hypothetical protein